MYPNVNRNARARENILGRVAGVKRGEVAALRDRAAGLRAAARNAPAARDFRAALSGESVALIAEVKRRSPSAGELAGGLDPAVLAGTYEAAGAACLSVLTDGDFFGGSLADLEAARDAVKLPVLRKDFVIDALQVSEARAAGADAVLLIVRLLSDPRLRDLHEAAAEYGMAVLVEVHDARELERALAVGASIVGINNRDLATFETRLEVSLELLPLVPAGVLAVAESGIRSAADVRALGEAGADAVLVGESLVVASDVLAAASALTGQPRGGRVRRVAG